MPSLKPTPPSISLSVFSDTAYKSGTSIQYLLWLVLNPKPIAIILLVILDFCKWSYHINEIAHVLLAKLDVIWTGTWGRTDPKNCATNSQEALPFPFLGGPENLDDRLRFLKANANFLRPPNYQLSHSKTKKSQPLLDGDAILRILYTHSRNIDPGKTEVSGSRRTNQPAAWMWVYPCRIPVASDIGIPWKWKLVVTGILGRGASHAITLDFSGLDSFWVLELAKSQDVDHFAVCVLFLFLLTHEVTAPLVKRWMSITLQQSCNSKSFHWSWISGNFCPSFLRSSSVTNAGRWRTKHIDIYIYTLETIT